MLYFAYGSNMSIKRLRSRVPSCRFISTAVLYKHTLRFHKVSKDGSGKADAYFTNCVDDYIYGVVFYISRIDKPALNKAEGKRYGYNQKQITVHDMDNASMRVFTYYATHIDADVKPFSWYKKLVLTGAKHYNLPDDYIASIAAVPIKPYIDSVNTAKRPCKGNLSPANIPSCALGANVIKQLNGSRNSYSTFVERHVEVKTAPPERKKKRKKKTVTVINRRSGRRANIKVSK